MGTDNIGRVKVEGERSHAVLDTGANVNLITPGYVARRNFPVYPLSDLFGSARTSSIDGIGEARFDVVGYVIIQVKIDGIRGYKEDTVALVLKRDSEFAERVPILLGTPTLDRSLAVIKESEIDQLAVPWAKARIALLLRAHRFLIKRAAARLAKGKSIKAKKTAYQVAEEVAEESGYSSAEPTAEELREMRRDPLEFEEVVRAG